MKLFIHIGNHRTGSTSIQKSLFENSKNLKKHNVIYPNTGLSGIAHHHLANSLRGKGTTGFTELSHPDEILDSFMDEILKSECHKVVVSSEEFMLCSEYNNKYFEKFLNFFDRVEVIFLLRNQVEHLESSYKFSVLWKDVSSTLFFSEFIEKNLLGRYHSYHHVYEFYSQFLNVYLNAVDFRAVVDGRCLLKKIYDIIGISEIYSEEIHNNLSLKRRATTILRDINSSGFREGLNVKKDMELVKELRDISDSGKNSLYDSRLYASVLDRYYEDNKILFDKIGVDLNFYAKNFLNKYELNGYSVTEEDIALKNKIMQAFK